MTSATLGLFDPEVPMSRVLPAAVARATMAALSGLLLLGTTAALAQAPGAAAASAPAPVPTARLRGTIEQVDANTIALRERNGSLVTLAIADKLVVTEVLPIELSALQPGSFIGTAAMPRADGTLEALEVLVFPESARGTGEGHRPYDLRPGSTMTNATVADLAVAPQGRTLVLRYKDGEKKLVVPDGTPLVTFKPADRSLLKAGAKVLVTAEERNGTPTAVRVLAGRDGFVPPL
jgi:hypothetical protein